MSKLKKILILGGTGMIGSYLTDFLRTYHSEISVVFTHRVCPRDGSRHFDLHTDDVNSIVKSVGPDLIFNFLPGHDDLALETNRHLLDIVQKREVRYVFMSTSLVFGDLKHFHREEDRVSGSGAYGVFKALCEREVAEALDDYVILRIAATHGARDGLPSRTMRFLERILIGEMVGVDAGVIQNRLWTGDLARMMFEVARCNISGPCHLGSVDASTEYEFLSRLAEAFGYDPSLVVSNPSDTRNLVVEPKKILLLSDSMRINEEETIRNIRNDRRLAKFIK